MAHERLQPEWILDWLREPGRIQPGTRMPAVLADAAVSEVVATRGLASDAETQIRAIRDHLMTLRGGPSPKRPARRQQLTERSATKRTTNAA